MKTLDSILHELTKLRQTFLNGKITSYEELSREIKIINIQFRFQSFFEKYHEST